MMLLICRSLHTFADSCRGVDLGSNALILPAGKAAAGSSKGSGANSEQPQQQLSKSQLKKLKQVQLKKERREQLSQVG